ncbi:MAG: DUF3793 family protein [Tissierellia bacterium]|nr:DUF3793 family protein [Tissierellia bacterium]
MNIDLTVLREKCGSLVSFKNRRNARNLWLKNKDTIATKTGIKFRELKVDEDVVMVLIYDENLLWKSLQDKERNKFLRSLGYNTLGDIDCFLDQLEERFQNDFPHEVGIFLDYPLCDIIQFMKNKHECLSLNGYWRVYENEAESQKLFRHYNSIKSMLANKLEQGENPKNFLLEKKLGLCIH